MNYWIKTPVFCSCKWNNLKLNPQQKIYKNDEYNTTYIARVQMFEMFYISTQSIFTTHKYVLN